MAAQTRNLVAYGVVAAVGLVVGILIGFYGIHKNKESVGENLSDLQPRKNMRDDKNAKFILDSVSPENIRKYVKDLSQAPHLAGTEEDNKSARKVRDTWLQQGLFDKVELVPYDVLLSYPDDANPNQVQLVSALNGNVEMSSSVYENIKGEKMVQAFHGYAPSGTVTGEPVYVNYGRVEDFDVLDNLGIAVSGKICIARYGMIYRGNKVINAQKRGAVGVVMYLDPSEVAREGVEPEKVYPNSFWMPGSAIQRGSVMIGSGDPQTPNYPSIDGAYRYELNKDNAKSMGIPTIPSQPIGYDDARKILGLMGGDEGIVPQDWKGGLNVTYRLGPGFQRAINLHIVVNNKYQTVTSYNVIGTVRGSHEPDRYVLVGSHRDAWGFGAIDPVSGTSQLLETTRVLGQTRKNGWTPRRTLVFCSWGAEEYGLVGSTEWVEENVNVLRDRAVAYVNTDSCVSGTAFAPSASPILAHFLVDITKLVPDPVQPAKTIYKTWKSYITDGKNNEEPRIPTLGSGTDHAPFSFFAGIPAINFWWRFDKKKYGTATYPAYHTAFETFELVDKFVDSKYSYHTSCSRLSGLLAYRLSDENLLPYNMNSLGDELEQAIDDVVSRHNQTLENNNITVDYLREAIINFRKEAENWHERIRTVNMSDPITLRMVNDQMMMVERVFILPYGLPNRATTRHAAFAPSATDQYSHAGFPGISDLINDISNAHREYKEDVADKMVAQLWIKLRRHVSDVMIVVKMATSYLKENPFN